LRDQDDLSMRRWITFSGAQAVASSDAFHNLNTPLELRNMLRNNRKLV
jgi:hypothetical protein